jgi:sporulation protein YlmC with PRC-barrel domain
VELNRGQASVSDLIGTPVRDSAGRPMGRVFEVRAHWEREGSIVLDELLVGRRGMWRRLRGPGDDDRGIPWEAVVELDDERIVVRA